MFSYDDLAQNMYREIKCKTTQATKFEEEIVRNFENELKVLSTRKFTPKTQDAAKPLKKSIEQFSAPAIKERPQSINIVPVFGEKEEIALKQLRKKFEFSSIYGDYLHKKKEFLENYVQQTSDNKNEVFQRMALFKRSQSSNKKQFKQHSLDIGNSTNMKKNRKFQISLASTTQGTQPSQREKEKDQEGAEGISKREQVRSRLQGQLSKQANVTELIQSRTGYQEHQKSTIFPGWVLARQEFKDLQQSKEFNLNLKLVSICEVQTFKRDDSQKTMVALYLQTLSLFKLMPFEMLVEIGGRLTTKSFAPREVICRQGDKGDCMYIIYKGEVEVVFNGRVLKVFQENEHLGRTALETDAPRSATLIAQKETHLLLLAGIDYQHCLSNIFKVERPKWRSFLDSVLFFRNFAREKIEKMCEELKGKFLSTKDCLYKVGDAGMQ